MRLMFPTGIIIFFSRLEFFVRTEHKKKSIKNLRKKLF